MTDDTASAADSAQEPVDLINPVTGETSQVGTDDMPDHGVLTMDLGGFAPDEPEPYNPAYTATMRISDGTALIVQDSQRGAILSLVNGDTPAGVQAEIAMDEIWRLSRSLRDASEAGADARSRKRRG
jgi:hypothetical protein